MATAVLPRWPSGENDFYYVFNAHGDVIQNGNQRKVVGIPDTEIETDANPFRYCGEYFDKETEEYYLRARYYDPATGRFGQEDTVPFVMRTGANEPVGIDPLSLNRYTYAQNDPVKYGDCNGNFALSIAGAVIGGLVGGLIGGLSSVIQGEDFWAGAAGGAVSGVIAGALIDPATTGLVAAVAIGAGAGIVGDVVTQVAEGTPIDKLDVGSILISGAVGGVLGGIGLGLGRGIETAARGLGNGIKNFMTTWSEMFFTGLPQMVTDIGVQKGIELANENSQIVAPAASAVAGGAAAVGAIPRQTTVPTPTPAVVPHYTPIDYAPPRYVTYTVKAGESPWSIAAKVLGDGSRYKEIQALTRWGGVDPGQRLMIPVR